MINAKVYIAQYCHAITNANICLWRSQSWFSWPYLHDALVVVCLAWQVNIAGAAWVCQEAAHQDGN